MFVRNGKMEGRHCDVDMNDDGDALMIALGSPTALEDSACRLEMGLGSRKVGEKEGRL